MVICNIVSERIDGVIEKYNKVPVINLVSDITHIQTQVPTLFYGYKTALKYFVNFNRSNRRISKSYLWSYSFDEIKSEVWVDEFVKECLENYIKYKDIGIDTVFYDVDLSKICNSLNKYPLICSGNHLIYICDYTDDGIVVYSTKKDTLDYVGLSTEQILREIAETLNHEYLVVETNDTEIKHPRPVNLLDMYCSITNESIGFDKLKSKFRGLKDLSKPEMLTIILQETKYLRGMFRNFQSNIDI